MAFAMGPVLQIVGYFEKHSLGKERAYRTMDK